MSEETTQNIPDPRSFEERVFARFDALDRRMDSMDKRLDGMDKRFDAMDKRFDDMDRRFDGLDARVQKLEEDSERRAVETKPIWERALAEILAIQQRLDKVEEALKDLTRRIDVLSIDMIRLRADHLGLERRVEKLEVEPTR